MSATPLTVQANGGELYGFYRQLISLLLPYVFPFFLSSGPSDIPLDKDPVVTSIGEYLSVSRDFSLEGPLPLVFARYFGSFVGLGAESNGVYAKSDGPLGANWLHNFFILLQRLDSDTVGVYYYQGRTLYFRRSGASWSQLPPASEVLYRGTVYQVAQSGSKLRLLDPELRLIFTFETAGMADRSLRGVESIQDRNGNSHVLSYNPDGTLKRVSDGLGRSLDFEYVTSGTKPRVSKVTDQTGRSLQFEYLGTQLRACTDARGRKTTYSSNADGRIETITRPAGNTPVRNTYAADKVSSQADGLGNLSQFSYSAASTTITDPTGNAVTHEFNSAKRWIGYVDQSGKRIRYGYDGFHRRTSTVDRMGDQSTLSYDSASGYVTSRTDNEGKSWRYGYTAQAQEGFTFYNLTRIDFPDGTSEQYSYDARGNMVSRSDRAGKAWRYTYNSRGQVLTATSPEGGVTTYGYNDDGTVASLQDPAGNVTTFDYDGARRPNRINHPDGTSARYSYDANDNLASDTNEKGKVTSYTYDDNNNLKSATNPLGQTWAFEYDANDNLTRITDPVGQARRFTYDALQRIRTATDPNGNMVTYNYDSRGRMTSLVDREGKSWSFAYDDEGVPASFTDPLGHVRRYSSDKQGRMKTAVDPLSNQTTLSYDALGRLASRANPLGETTSYSYDPRGLLSQVSLPDAITAAYVRNDIGEIARIVDARGKARLRAYDTSGRITSSADPLGNTMRFSYDTRNRPKRVDLPASTLDLGYDGLGLLTSLAYSDNTRLEYSYDDANRLISASGLSLAYDDAGRLTSSNGISIGRDSGGRITSMTLEAGKTVRYSYDRRNLLTSVADWASGSTQFSYDDAGRLTRITRPNGTATTYSYDNANRLTGIAESKGQTTISSITLSRDGAGQIKEATRSTPLEAAPVQGGRNLAFDDADQVVGYSYDALGRLAAGGGRTYQWDLASRLASYQEGQSTVSFTYDAFGSLLSRTQGSLVKNYVWNYALRLPSVSVAKEGESIKRYYVHTPNGSLLYSLEATDNVRRYYHFDEMGSTLFLTDDGGAVTDSYAYTPYGKLTGATGVSDNPFTFGGKFGVMREPATGLYYMRARYYDSATGRFLSRDPAGFSLLDPRSLNSYQFVLENPLRFIDPGGTCPPPVAPDLSSLGAGFSVDVQPTDVIGSSSEGSSSETSLSVFGAGSTVICERSILIVPPGGTGGKYGMILITNLKLREESEGPRRPQPPPAESPAPGCGGAPEGMCGPTPSCGDPGCQFNVLPSSYRQSANKEVGPVFLRKRPAPIPESEGMIDAWVQRELEKSWPPPPEPVSPFLSPKSRELLFQGLMHEPSYYPAMDAPAFNIL